MKRLISSHLFLWLLLCSGFTAELKAQQSNCLPAPPPTPNQPNIFTQEQEVFLGDIVAEKILKDYRIIEDAELTAFLTRTGERLVKYLPLEKIKLQFFLVDLPDANAFVLPGGRVYVSRKLVALVRSEDELAGVISHELGHLAARDAAIDFTRLLKDLLGVTQVTDRRDIFEKYNQLVDNAARKAVRLRDREKGQMVADQMGFFALVSAGYDPAAQARFWDRMTEIKGRKGGFFSDLFGTTKPEERRYREMMRAVSSLPAGCVKNSNEVKDEAFKSWQSSVIAYTGLGRREALHGVLAKKQLSPPLRSDIVHLRFSPNGNYVLAQDDAGINVLTREPFALVFRIEAPDAFPASFTPDSQNIVFYTDNLRVERWSVAEEKMLSVKEVIMRKGCLQTALSPDGNFLACLNTDFDLDLLDVASDQSVMHKKEFFAPNFSEYVWMLSALYNRGSSSSALGLHLLEMSFSPDGHYFVAGFYGLLGLGAHRYGVSSVALDMRTLSKVSLPDNIQELVTEGFAFVGNDRLIGLNRSNNKKSALVTFPEGQVVSEITLWPTRMTSATRGDYLLVSPVREYPLGVIDLNTKVITKVNLQPALDIYNDIFVAELRSGELGLYRMEKNTLLATATLPNVSLGRVRVAELSPDMKWLALSSRSRGGVWNLNTNEAAIYVRGFRGGFVSRDGYFYGDFPKFETAERNIAKFDLATGDVTPGAKIELDNTTQIGPFVVVIKSAKGNVKEGEFVDYRKNVMLDILDARGMNKLWSKTFPKEAPRVWVGSQSGTVALVWDVKDEAAVAAIKDDPRLSQQLTAMKEKEGDYFLQILDAQNGNELGKLLIETGKGSFRLSGVLAAGDWVTLTDTQNRVLVYSLKTGELKGRAFGKSAAVSPANNLLCVENERGSLAVYDLKTMEKLDQFVFSSPVAAARFNMDGRQLFVLTSNQTAYILNTAALTTQSSTK